MAELDPAFAARLLPARPDLAAESLRDRVAAARYVPGMPMRVTSTLLDLTQTPDAAGERATQLLAGETFTVYEERADGLAWGQAEADGYVGYVDGAGLVPAEEAALPGPPVTALWSHVYPAPELRARPIGDLPMLARPGAAGRCGAFVALEGGGFAPAAHFDPVYGDFVGQAERLLGAPYLWGGRSARGLDCSALVQLALMATGRAAPRDSDMQAAGLGVALAAGARLVRGDLVFWKGHVGIMRDADTLLHANAHHMAVASEPLAVAAARIEASGGGPPTLRRRPD